MKKAIVNKNCPRCGNQLQQPPVLSSRDNKTDICSYCKRDEALIDFNLKALPPTICQEISFLKSLVLAK